MLKLLKSQDKKYIQLKKTTEDNKIARLQSSLHMVSQEHQNKHLTFSLEDEKNEKHPQEMEKKNPLTTKLVDNMPTIEEYDSETEEKIKELTKATIRCIPLNNEQEEGKCVLTGNPSKQRVLFARAY